MCRRLLHPSKLFHSETCLYFDMPPIRDGIVQRVQDLITSNKVIIFSKRNCPFCVKVKNLFFRLGEPFEALELDEIDDGAAVQSHLTEITGLRTVPSVYINGTHIGGCDDTLNAYKDGRLDEWLGRKKAAVENSHMGDHVNNVSNDRQMQRAVPKGAYNWDLLVIGGGSGGLAAAKQAAGHGVSVVCVDFVKPSPFGTAWGLGGTCVNVGCIPKKLMHQAALLNDSLKDAKYFGWEVPEQISHNWSTMINNIQDHIGSLNWGYRVSLRDKNVTYKNSFAEFVDPHTVKLTNKRGKEEVLTAANILLATGGRPRYPDIPGAKEYCITSDDLFSLAYPPGRTLIVGASYIALECASFLQAFGFETTILVRSILLRGFDQQMSEMIGERMAKKGVTFIRPAIPLQIEQLEAGSPGKLKVTYEVTINDKKEIKTDIFNTVMFAIGRNPYSAQMKLEEIGVKLNPKTGKVVTNNEQTSLSHIFAIGDIVDGGLELTPVAIQAGRLLTDRLFKGARILMDYRNVATTVFSSIEYGAIGYSEEDALSQFGEANIEVFHHFFQPLEWTLPHKDPNLCYAKLVCLKTEKNKVIGFHVLGPNAGEMTQGYAVAIKMGATHSDFIETVGIHPTCSEIFTTLTASKTAGDSPDVTGC